MKRCKKCILPETFPGISFDDDGVCSQCNEFNNKGKFIPSIDSLRIKLYEVFEEAKAQNLKYDAVVAYSGGKDSTYLLYALKKIYGLNPLAVTFDNGYMSDYSFENMRVVLEQIDVDHIIHKPNKGILKKIFVQSADENIYPEHLTNCGSGVCISCIRIVTNLVLRVAIEKKIPMVLLGNSPGQLLQSEDEIMFKDNVIPYQLRKILFKKLADKAGEDIYYHMMLNKEEYKTKPFPMTVNAFPIIGYDEDNIYKTIGKLGWKKPSDVDPNSTNCRLNSWGIVKHKKQYKFHPYDFEMSMLIRLGIISRNRGLERVEDKNAIALQYHNQIDKEMTVE